LFNQTPYLEAPDQITTCGSEEKPPKYSFSDSNWRPSQRRETWKARIEIKQSRVQELEAHEKKGPALSNADLDAAAGTPEEARRRKQEAAPEDGAKVSEAIAAMRVTDIQRKHVRGWILGF
jgi:hypothetical protein